MERPSGKTQWRLLHILIKLGQINLICECGEQVHKLASYAGLQQTPSCIFSRDERHQNKKLYRSLKEMLHQATSQLKITEYLCDDTAEQYKCE